MKRIDIPYRIVEKFLVEKRDGRYVEFNIMRIYNAIKNAFVNNDYPIEEERLNDIVNKVVEKIIGYKLIKNKEIEDFGLIIVSVEKIQDIVIKTLMEMGYYDIAKKYIEYKKERDIVRKEHLNQFGVIDDWKMSDSGFFVFAKRYLLRDKNGNIIETPKGLLMRVARYIAIPELIYLNKAIKSKIEYVEIREKETWRKVAEIKPLKQSLKINGETDIEEFEYDYVDNYRKNVFGIRSFNLMPYIEDEVFLIKELIKGFKTGEYKDYKIIYKINGVERRTSLYKIFSILERLELNEYELYGLIRAFYYIISDYVYEKDEKANNIYSFFVMVSMIDDYLIQRYFYWRDRFYNLMVSRRFLPNSPTLFNAGTELPFTYACNVLPIYDNISGIYRAVKLQAILFKYGGGVGINFSPLRPKNALIKSNGGKSSGAIAFMELFNTNTEVIKQGGKRRGANMGILDYNHPDIVDFINIKNDISKLTNFNLSVMVDEKFWEALENDDFIELYHSSTGITGKIKAKELYDNIVINAWRTGEPAMLFKDNINKDNPFKRYLGEINATNPCSEQGLYPYESCNLGSINLSRFVINGKLNEEELVEAIKVAMRFLENTIDMSIFVSDEFRINVRRLRRVGLGMMGFADMLIKLGIMYGDEKSKEIAEKIGKIFKEISNEYSVYLAQERGYYPFLIKLINEGKYNNDLPERRNGFLLSIAPTGSLSLFAQTSSSIEPIFKLAYMRYFADGTLFDIHPLFKEWLNKNIKNDMERAKIINEVYENDGMITERLKEKYPELRLFITSSEIKPDVHIDILGIFAKYIDTGISKTINLPEEATVEDVKHVFYKAHKLGIKGITIYRENSRRGVIVSKKKEKKKEAIIYGSRNEECQNCSTDITEEEVKQAMQTFEIKTSV